MLILLCSVQLYAQPGDSLIKFSSAANLLPDSLLDNPESLKKEISDYLEGKGKLFRRSINKKDLLKDSLKNFIPGASIPLLPKFSTPSISVYGGRAEYTTFYRSNIDTPYSQKNLYQHQVNTTMNILVGNQIPLRVSALFRRTNSDFFGNLNDVRVEFDVAAFQQQLKLNAVTNLQVSQYLRDSLAGHAIHYKLSQYTKLNEHFNEKFNPQRLTEEYEKIVSPDVSWNYGLPDSLAQLRSDSIKESARTFLRLYEKSKAELDSVKVVYDSLTALYNGLTYTIGNARQAIEGNIKSYISSKEREYGSTLRKNDEAMLPRGYRWLLGIRKFSIGKSFLNYSELTANNIPVKGINVEYNSRYYLAFSAGLVEPLFRNIFADNSRKFHQYFMMGRVGLGQPETNHIILSVYRGNKQSAAPVTAGNSYKYNVTGMSIEAKYLLANNGYLKAEVGQSISPDFKKLPVKNTAWTPGDKTNKALHIQLHYNIRKIDANVEGSYKYTGANYQSFSAYQVNAALSSYNIRWDQYLFRRQLKISGAIRCNEFSNPFLIQQYKSNTVFKSIMAVFRKRRWPVLSVSYMPISQYSVAGSLVIENRFNSLNINAVHFYKLGDIRASSVLMLTKFYNSGADSGFIYFNARNIMVSQVFNFERFDAVFGISHSTNSTYQFTSMYQHIQLPLKKVGTLLFGVKINKLNDDISKLGYYGSYRLPVRKRWGFSFFFEQGCIASVNGQMVNNKTGNIQLTKTF